MNGGRTGCRRFPRRVRAIVSERARARPPFSPLPHSPSWLSHRNGFLWTPVIIQSTFPNGRRESTLRLQVVFCAGTSISVCSAPISGKSTVDDAQTLCEKGVCRDSCRCINNIKHTCRPQLGSCLKTLVTLLLESAAVAVVVQVCDGLRRG